MSHFWHPNYRRVALQRISPRGGFAPPHGNSNLEDLIRRQALLADHHVRPPNSDAGALVVAPTMRAHEVEDWKRPSAKRKVAAGLRRRSLERFDGMSNPRVGFFFMTF